MNQRSVQLHIVSKSVSGSTTQTVLVGPPDGHTAPSGYYMIFAVDQNRVPSIAKIVHLGKPICERAGPRVPVRALHPA